MIRRLTMTSALCGWTLSVCCGCAHMLETRTIELFAQALEQQNLKELRASTSDEFAEKALRRTEALKDFEFLNLPEGEVTVVKVIDEVTDDEQQVKQVTVEVGEKKRKLRYRLLKDDDTEKWVVDDIHMRQKRKGLTAASSVTEQMDLFLSVREFLTAWERGDRNQVLAVTTPELGQLLGELHPAYLAQITKQMIGERTAGAADRGRGYRTHEELTER